jgi:cell division septal protein FtsQ
MKMRPGLYAGAVVGILLTFAILVAPAVEQKLSSLVSIEYVTVVGELEDSQRNEITKVLRENKHQASSIDRARQVLESIEWVDYAQVAWRWPNELRVEVVSLVPIAFWNDDAFISKQGRTFRSEHLAPG